MHNVCEVWLGQDMYDFDAQPYNYHHKVNAGEDLIKLYRETAEELIQKKTILWYFMTLTEFNPETGESTTKTWHKRNELKEKIYLNKDAKQAKKEVNLKHVLQGFGINDPFAGADVHMNYIPEPPPAPLWIIADAEQPVQAEQGF